jgi:hypothetical protein
MKLKYIYKQIYFYVYNKYFHIFVKTMSNIY